MKVFLSESQVDYASYTFSYAPYAVREPREDLSPIYEKGFLPYTGDLTLEAEIFYMARSLRVDLARFTDSSENRRVDRQMEPLNVDVEVFEKSQFDAENEEFKAFCEAYIKVRIGDEHMSLARWEYVLKSSVGSHILQFTTAGKVLGYVLAGIGSEMLHYWFAIFDIEYMKSHSLGKWMMWKTIAWCKDQGLSYTYLGTAYKESALYKIRDHKGLEFWDGYKWNSDVKLLKELCKADLQPQSMDFFKRLADRNGFLSGL